MPIDEFKNSGPPIDESDIRRLERQLRVRLPPAYRAFLLRANGGSPCPQDAFGALGDRNRGSVLGFFYAVTHDTWTLTIAQRQFAFSGRIPSDLLPIAHDAFGDKVCISVQRYGLRWRNYGKIYFWDMEMEHGPGRRPWRRNIRLIANDFDEFLDSFFDSEEFDTEQLG